MNTKSVLIFIFGFIAASVGTQAQNPELEKIRWQNGPTRSKLGDLAEINVPAGYKFADASDTRTLMRLLQNPPSGQELGYIEPADGTWFMVFEFNDIGYVSDDEKRSLDADAILENLKKGTEQGNIERRKKSWPELHVQGWMQKPAYNDITHNLEWAILAESEGRTIVNYNTRLLGRGGVMRVTLVTDPDALQQTLPRFKNAISGFSYSKGNTYAEFLPTDKKAQYGLTALVAGGAAAAVVKSGGAKWLGKAIIAGIIVLMAAVKKLFSKSD